MSSTRIEQLIADAQAAFDQRLTDTETGLDTNDAAVLQLRKGCRLLAGAKALREEGYYTPVIEASFVAIERTVEFRLLERGTEPRRSPWNASRCISGSSRSWNLFGSNGRRSC